MLVILCGPPCTGKSTIGAQLERELGFTHLDVDTIRQRLLPNSDQRTEDRDVAYRGMHLVAEHLLRSGKSVIMNATYNRELHRREAASITNKAALIQCRSPLETVMSRFRSRPAGHAALDLTDDLVRDLWTNYVWSSDGVVVETFEDALAHVKETKGDSLGRWINMK
jgi:predicted kinase